MHDLISCTGSEVGFADIITNPTRERAEIKAVVLVDPVNLHFDGGRAGDVRKDGALYFRPDPGQARPGRELRITT